MNKYFGLAGISLALLCSSNLPAQTVKPQWPEITQQNKPWSRWWWEGSAVNQKDLSWIMKEYQQAGLGGLEVTAIYGVKGYEKQFIDFTSPKWMDMLSYTLKEGEKLGLGIDVAQASGWPFGGPWVSSEDASKYVAYKTYSLKSGESLKENIRFIQQPIVRTEGQRIDISKLKEPVTANPDLQLHAFDQVRFEKPLLLQTLMAYSDKGEAIDLTAKVDASGKLNWTAPAGNWDLYALFMGWHGKMVERAGPGGEGYAIDHFSKKATTDYLDHFTQAFKGHDVKPIRAFFNDSYEVDDARGEADWTPQFFADFERLRGYDLHKYLPALFGKDSEDNNRRVLCDYRETISDLLLENYTKTWHQWAKGEDALIRNQAHGSPANILDLYAATDIPEAEGTDILRIKFASSAAHVTGKLLASSESATWDNEHFLSKLGEIKTAMDRFLLGGINHMFYHGTAYTPKDAPWPGWLFYAAVHFTPDNPFWDDFSSLNKYVAHCQSFMQQGKPDNDVLLYLPIYDTFSTPGRTMLQHFDGIDKGFKGTVLEESAEAMQSKGYSFDFISDAQLQNTRPVNNLIETGGVTYKTVVVPAPKYIPVKTFRKLEELAKSGATVILYKSAPSDVPGFHDLQQRRDEFKKLMAQLSFSGTEGLKKAALGKGAFLLGDNLDNLLKAANVERETMVDEGLQSVRRKYDKGACYFITNWGNKAVDGWIPVQVNAASVALFNPMTEKTGYAAVRKSANNTTEVYLQLEKGESCILQTSDAPTQGFTYQYTKSLTEPVSIQGTWDIQFIKGGPKLPAEVKTSQLKSWTEFDGQDVKSFSGTAKYTITFKKPKGKADAWMLNLGEVHESASVKLNGKEMGTVIGPDYQLEIPSSLLEKKNVLEVNVSNLMANRIEYMDKNNLPYKIFYNTNMPARFPQNRGKDGLFTAKNWQPQPSGLLGPVTVTGLKFVQP